MPYEPLTSQCDPKFYSRSIKGKENPERSDKYGKASDCLNAVWGKTMGAYVENRRCAYKSWKQVVRKRQILTLGPHYRHALHDECLMAVVFGYNAPLLAKILTFSHPSEFDYIKDLFAQKIDIRISNGNLVISN